GRCRLLRNLFFDKERRFIHEELGWNFRMTNLQAALGIAQLEKLDDSIARKRHIGLLYTELLSGISDIQLPLKNTEYADNIYWVYGIVLRRGILFNATEAIKRLKRNNIGCRHFFWPMHIQPVFQKMGLFKNESYPVAERLAKRGFYIPSGLALIDEQIKRVSDTIKEILR
ncbi:MAG: DegT/DnrJ/EryC1/StrS family aminotransferase, partial [Actinobacteria bacterium]|nr:DegT/DnrJ/EryC1/StrS family aminotransferase [Actinomycetota bacterium]